MNTENNELDNYNACRKHQDIEVYGEYGQRGCEDCVFTAKLVTQAANKAAEAAHLEGGLEELEEIFTMAKTNYEHSGNPNMKTLGQYCLNRIEQLKALTTPKGADNE